MLRMSIAAAAAAALFSAGPAQADGITLCFASQVANVTLMSELTGVETAIVINGADGTPSVKADNLYGKDSVVGSYWTSALPQTVTLPAGCSTIYFMAKTTMPSTSSQWACAAPAVGTGPTDAAGNKWATASGSVGVGVLSGVALIPGYPNAAPVTTSDCPRGY